MEESKIELPVVKLTNYQKRKESIYKWRLANEEKYLLSLHTYYKKQMDDPELKIQKLEKIKDYQNKVKEKKIANGEPIKKRGRPSKY
jgi:hypothetical protein